MKKPNRTLQILRKVSDYFIVFLLSLLAAELTIKIFFAFKVGPGILLPGVVNINKEHQTVNYRQQDIKVKKRLSSYNKFQDKYSKYSPHQRLLGKDVKTKKTYKITINNKGFRGEDYTVEKKKGTIRIVTLGASSTFGLLNRDNETYPYYMENILNTECKNKVFEVLNIAIPHANSNKILALFFSEVIQLNPDVVTFYEGINDTRGKVLGRYKEGYKKGHKKRHKKRHKLRKSANRYLKFMREHVLFIKYITFVASNFSKEKFSKQDFSDFIDGRSKRFLANLSIINEECRNRGIKFIVANQQTSSGLAYIDFSWDQIVKDKRKLITEITYQKEVEMTKNKLSNDGYLRSGLKFLAHSVLMKDLKIWTLTNNVPFVDIIEALNPDRSVLLTWVHLDSRGNKIIAKNLTKKILEELPCNLSNRKVK